MKLNHLNLTVTDVSATKGFLERYFGLTCARQRTDRLVVMFDKDGFVLTLMQGRDVHYPGSFHIGFPQENEEQVDEINRRLRQDGYEVSPPKRAHAYTFYVKAPGDFTVEISC